MAAEASGRAARVVAARLDEAEGTKAEAAEAPARTIRAESFIIDNFDNGIEFIVKVGQRSEYVDGSVGGLVDARREVSTKIRFRRSVGQSIESSESSL